MSLRKQQIKEMLYRLKDSNLSVTDKQIYAQLLIEYYNINKLSNKSLNKLMVHPIIGINNGISNSISNMVKCVSDTINHNNRINNHENSNVKGFMRTESYTNVNGEQNRKQQSYMLDSNGHWRQVMNTNKSDIINQTRLFPIL